jgi:PAT family beta-lactamase induction signal transducer AmpG
MLALAFATGLPFLLVFSTLSVRLREAGVALHTIGMFSWLGLAYTLKFLWAPFVDAIDIPVLAKRFGRRRAWMMASQVFVAWRWSLRGRPTRRPASPGRRSSRSWSRSARRRRTS